MTERVHGHVFPGEFLTGKMDFFTVRTNQDIRPTGLANDLNDDKAHTAGTDVYIDQPSFPATIAGVTYANAAAYNLARASQRRFDTLIQTISLRAQPIIVGDVTVTTETAPVLDLPAAVDGPVYTFRFAVEHTQVWDAEDLCVALDGLEGFEYSLGTTTGNNVAVAVETSLKK
jgi:hypothetical protein